MASSLDDPTVTIENELTNPTIKELESVMFRVKHKWMNARFAKFTREEVLVLEGKYYAAFLAWHEEREKLFRYLTQKAVEFSNPNRVLRLQRIYENIQADFKLDEARHEEKVAVLGKLSTIDFEAKQRKLRSLRVEGSGAWLLASDEYRLWSKSPHSILLCCYGPLGCGKSVLASVVIDQNPNAIYHYCDYADQKTLSYNNIIKSLIFQLLVSGDPSSHFLAAIRQKLEGHNFEVFEDTGWIKELLLSSVHLKGSGIIVIDGIDEMNAGASSIFSEILQSIFQTPGNNFKIFLTSRHREAVTFSKRRFHNGGNRIWLRISQQCVSQDMERYVDSEIDRLVQVGALVIRNPELLVEVKQRVLAGACGTFLWVHFKLAELCNAKSDFQIEECLEELPRELSDTYDRLLCQITGMGPETTALISKMFKWILLARRPLTEDELADGMAIDIHYSSNNYLLSEDIRFVRRLIQRCGSIVQVDEETTTVSFSHPTVHQFLLSSRVSKAGFQFTWKEANNTIGKACVAYLKFSGFNTQITSEYQDPGHELDVKLPTNAIDKKSPEFPRQGSGANISDVVSLRTKQRRFSSGLKNNKFRLLDYITHYWLWHTRYFLQDLPETSTSMRQFRLLLVSQSSMIDTELWKPWTTTTVSETGPHVGIPQEYLKWLDDVKAVDADPYADVLKSTNYDSDQAEDDDLDSDVSSIFSKATIDSGTYASSIPLIVVQGAEAEFIAMLAEDEMLKPLYKIAATKLKPERFERNFARLLKMYADDLRKGIPDDLQKSAIGLVRSRRRHIAKTIRLGIFTSVSEQSHAMDELRLQSVDPSVNLEQYLGRYMQVGVSESLSETIEPFSISEKLRGEDPMSGVENLDPGSNSDSSEEGDEDPPSFPNLVHLRWFLSSGNALPNLRDGLKAFLEPQLPKRTQALFDKNLDTPLVSEAYQDQSVADLPEGTSCGRMVFDHVRDLDIPQEFERPDLQYDLGKDSKYSSISKRGGETTTSTNAISKLERLFQLIAFIVSYLTSIFLGPVLPLGISQLRWTCRCGHISYDEFVLLTPDGLQYMLDELKSSGIVTAASIDSSTTSSSARGLSTWNSILTLPSQIKRSLSRKSKTPSLPVSEKQTTQASQQSHQRRPECKFLQVCVEKGPYSTRMHYIDVCDKKTDLDIFRTLRKDYKDLRRELHSVLFKIQRIDFVEFQMYPKELVDSLIPDQLPPPPPENNEYEYAPMPAQTSPPVPKRLMMHLWHCKEEFEPGNFFSKKFPKKKNEPCKYVLDESPTANLGWGLHIVETLDISLIVWILFGATAISGLVFGISWSLLKNDVSGAFTVAAWITALMTLLVMAVMSALTRM